MIKNNNNFGIGDPFIRAVNIVTPRLEQNDIPYGLWAGVAAKIYGSERDLSQDIDGFSS